jgi:hypothetical protein
MMYTQNRKVTAMATCVRSVNSKPDFTARSHERICRPCLNGPRPPQQMP